MKTTLAFFLACCFCCSCHKKQDTEASTGTCLSDTIAKLIALDTVRPTKVLEQLKLSGQVDVDESKMIKVFPLVGGQVTDMKIELGDYVNKGDVLAILRSAEAAEIEKDIVGDASKVEITTKNMQVAEDMYKSGLLSEKDYVTAKSEQQKAKAEYERSKELYNIYSLEKNSHYVIRAPMSGFVVEKDVNAGTQLRSDNANSIFTISNLSNVWVLANVYESDIEKVNTGYPVSIQTVSHPDKIFKGKIDKIYNVIDPDSKVLKVRIKIDNPDYLLKPGMFATILVHHETDDTKLAVPANCVIFDNNKNYVVLYHDKCHIEIREVKVSDTVKGFTYIDGGLLKGDVVVSKYQLLAYNAFKD